MRKLLKGTSNIILILLVFFSNEALAANVQIDSLQVTPVTGCDTNANGEITIYASGASNIEYSTDGINWQDTNYFDGIPGGSFLIRARDADESNATIADTLIEIPSPDKLEVEIIKTDKYKNREASITIHATGGTGTLSYGVGETKPLTYTGNNIYTGIDTGMYHVSVKDDNGCTYDTTIQVDTIIPLNINVQKLNSPSCHPANGTPDGEIYFIVNEQAANVTLPLDYYAQATNNSENSFEILDVNAVTSQNYPFVAPDTFHIFITDQSNPPRYYLDTIVFSGPEKMIIQDTTLMDANCLFVLSTAKDSGEIHIDSVSGGTAPYNYTWSRDPVNTTSDAIGLTGGKYSGTITDDKGCTLPFNFTIDYSNSKQTLVTISDERDTTCQGMEYELEGNTVNADNYRWEEMNTEQGRWIEVPETIYPLNTARYRLLAWNEYNCSYADTMLVYIYEPIGVNAGENIFANANTSDFTLDASVSNQQKYILDYEWSARSKVNEGGLTSMEIISFLDDPTELNPTFTVPGTNTQDTFEYRITVTSEFGCVERDTMLVGIKAVINIPSAFSPNNDGINDKWNIPISKHEEVEVTVISRWGETVFSEKGKNISWDGRQKSKDLPMGTYYFVITVYRTDGEVEELTGPVTILR